MLVAFRVSSHLAHGHDVDPCFWDKHLKGTLWEGNLSTLRCSPCIPYSLSKDPTLVQPHLNKAFEGIAKVRFDSKYPSCRESERHCRSLRCWQERSECVVFNMPVQSKCVGRNGTSLDSLEFKPLHAMEMNTLRNEIIEAMTSGEGETVDFTNKVDVTKPGNAGAVECWLVEVEEAMMDILREVTDKSNKAYPSADRVKWLVSQCHRSSVSPYKIWESKG